MYSRTDNFKRISVDNSNNAVKFVIFFNIDGVIVSLALTIVLLFTLKKIN